MTTSKQFTPITCVRCEKRFDVNMVQNVKIPPPLSAKDKSGFAYKTIKDRLPVIVVKTIDFLHRQRKELHKFGGTLSEPNDSELVEIENDAKQFITHLTRLRKDLETNKEAVAFEKLTNLPPELEYFNDDVEAWNRALEANKLDDGSPPRYFDSPWLLVECYLYRKIKEAALQTKHLKMFDPFVEQKQAACRAALPQMVAIANHLADVEKVINQSSSQSHPSERSEFSLFIQLALWANKSDLSISGMSADKILQHKRPSDIREPIENMQDNILCDNISEVWFKAQSLKDKIRSGSSDNNPVYIDIVADNSGYELYVDLCLLHFLALLFCGPTFSESLKFRIHVKRMPWFVSDSIRQDVEWLISFLTAPEQDAGLQSVGRKWRKFLDSNSWEMHDHRFWTLPNDFAEMQSVAPDLYSTLQKSSLIVFKGDLNYRKLTGDRKWHILTPFRVALREFSPASLVALRTAKADTVVGIEDVNIFAKINNNELPRDWMISGDYGFIQYVDPF